MSHLFAAVLLFFSPGCPHEEPNCLTPTEYVEVWGMSDGLKLARRNRGTHPATLWVAANQRHGDRLAIPHTE
jgi:hypothetical protein